MPKRTDAAHHPMQQFTEASPVSSVCIIPQMRFSADEQNRKGSVLAEGKQARHPNIHSVSAEYVNQRHDRRRKIQCRPELCPPDPHLSLSCPVTHHRCPPSPSSQGAPRAFARLGRLAMILTFP